MTNTKKNHNTLLILTLIVCIIAFAVAIGIDVFTVATTPKENPQVQTTIQTDGAYVLRAQVIGVDEEEDVVACVDTVGNVWEFYGVEDWHEGDFVLLLMDTCGTQTIYDDAVFRATADAFVI